MRPWVQSPASKGMSNFITSLEIWHKFIFKFPEHEIAESNHLLLRKMENVANGTKTLKSY
jgi:hypothetical protein